MARTILLADKKVTPALSADEPPTGAEMVDITGWWRGNHGPRIVGVALKSDQAGGSSLTGGKVWVSHSGILGGIALELGELDAVMALSTIKGVFRRTFDLGGWEKVGVSGTPSAGSAVTVEFFPIESDGAAQ